jgi:hypothetical protein
MTLIFLTDNNFSKCDFSFWIFIPGILTIIKLVSISNKPVGHTYKLTYLNFNALDDPINLCGTMLGLLAFCAKGIPSIRAFIRRFYALLATLKQRKSYYLIRVTSDVKEDTLVILEFLEPSLNKYQYLINLWGTRTN